MKRRNLDIKKRKVTPLKYSDIKRIRRKILKQQGGKCFLCEKKPDRPVLDHEHKKKLGGSGRVRGVLCSSCNVFLAKMENNCIRYAISMKRLPSVLRNTIKYITKEHPPLLHPSEKVSRRKLRKDSYNKLKKLIIEDKGRVPKSLQYAKSGFLTVPLRKAFKRYNLKPEFYKK